jgi:hypothetical protein
MSIYRVGDIVVAFAQGGPLTWPAPSEPGGGDGTPVGGLTTNVYNYLNSLYDHAVGDGDENTNVKTWVTRFAAAAPTPNSFTQSAEFGFFSQWEPPPRFNDVLTWGPASSVIRVGFTPDNFDGQSRDPSVGTPGAFDGEAYTPYLAGIVDAWEANAPNAERIYYVYAGSPNLGAHGGSGDDPATLTPTQYANWVAYGLGAYNDWMELLVSQLQAARPSQTFRLHNVNRATLLAFQNTVVGTIDPTVLFEDLAPHGRPTWYCLKAVAEYIELFDEKPPAITFDPGWGVSPILTANFGAVVDYIWGVLRP